MSLKSALMQIQQEKKEKEITDIIQNMLMEQQRLLDEGCVNNTVNKDGDITKVKKEWNENVLGDYSVPIIENLESLFDNESAEISASAPELD